MPHLRCYFGEYSDYLPVPIHALLTVQGGMHSFWLPEVKQWRWISFSSSWCQGLHLRGLVASAQISSAKQIPSLVEPQVSCAARRNFNVSRHSVCIVVPRPNETHDHLFHLTYHFHLVEPLISVKWACYILLVHVLTRDMALQGRFPIRVSKGPQKHRCQC